MARVVFNTPGELKAHIGAEVHVGDWMEVTQARVDQFAAATGDHAWIHVDVDRARRESPYGGTIAHGMLTLTMISVLMGEILLPWSKAGVYYGVNKVRFPAPVPVGSRIRGRVTLADAEEIEKGLCIIWRITAEREGGDKPVCIAETMSMQYWTA